VVPQDPRKARVCLYYQLSSPRDSIFIQGEQDDNGSSHPSQAALSTETSVRRPSPHRTCQTPAHVVAGFIVVAIIAFPVIVAVIGDFAFEVVSTTDSENLDLRLFTNKFNHLVGPHLQHLVEIGHMKLEVSFGFRSDTLSAHNVIEGARSIPGLTSPLYAPPLHLDITRVDRTFWKSFSPRPTIHPPEMALSGSNNPGQCWEFAGYSGQLGIQLPVPAQLTSFIIEHTWDKSFTESVPRNIVLWGLVPTDSIDPDPHVGNTSSSPLHPQFGTSYISIQLASVVFDAIQGQPRQTFMLRHTVTH
jgi:hypothetical protein